MYGLLCVCMSSVFSRAHVMKSKVTLETAAKSSVCKLSGGIFVYSPCYTLGDVYAQYQYEQFKNLAHPSKRRTLFL